MKVFIETLGCPKNFNDSQAVAGILEKEGNSITENLEEADAIIVNTCGFINDAKTESIDRIFQMAKEGKTLIVSGCLTQRYGNELYEEMPEVDIFLGVNDYEKLPEILKNHKKGQREKFFSKYSKDIDTMNRKIEENQYTSTIKISEGCDNNCAYCVIPQIRGKYRSRKKEDIIDEAKLLAEKGIKEIILIGQDVTAYGIDLYDEFVLYQLVEELCKIDEIKWIRLMYCYEDRITEKLIEVMQRESKVCNYIDIPIQHASNNVLSAMKRRSTRESIEKTISDLRKAIPDIHIRTTLITGFPGETEEDFNELLEFVETMKFERLGVFTYSPEEGTVAATMKNQIAQEEKEQRKEAIMRRQIEISLKNNEKKIGETLEVLIEGVNEDGSYYGRSMYDAPEIDNEVLLTGKVEHKAGDFVKIIVKDGFDYDLVGEEI